MSRITELKVNSGDVLTAERWNQLVDLLARALEGPEVSGPLTWLDGVIGLGQDYQVYYAKTTATISARVGTQWGSGDASFLTLSSGGVESTMPGFAGFTAWSPFGASIDSGIRISVAWSYEKWIILGGDCSGVA